MKLNNLIPLKEVSPEKLRELFKKDSNFAWNLRHYAESCEADFVQEVFKSFSDKVKLEWEFGIYSKCSFSVNHDPSSLHDFALGCIKILKDYGFFKEEDAKFIEALAIQAISYQNCDPQFEDEILEKAYIAMDGVASIIADRLRETFKYWESDNNVLDDRLDDFIECYGEDVFLDPTNDTLVEIKKMDTWDFY